MSHKSQPILTSYVNKQDSLDTYLHEWRTIRQSRVESPNEDDLQEKDEHGKTGQLDKRRPTLQLGSKDVKLATQPS